MKRILLSLTTLIATTLIGYAQHTQTATGFSNTTDGYGSPTAAWEFTQYFTSGGGGYDDVKLDTMKFTYGMNANSSGYYIFSLLNTVDLSAPNNTLHFSISATGANNADTSFTANIGFEDASSNHLSAAESITLTKAYTTKDITLTLAASQSFASVKKIVITMDNSAVAGVRNGTIYITKLQAGSSITAGTKDASANIASSKLFPNPVSDEANVELNLKSSSSVRVTLSDLMGKEVMTIADGTFSSLNKSFSVAGLNKGIYTVNYFVDGAAAKAEMLMVK